MMLLPALTLFTCISCRSHHGCRLWSKDLFRWRGDEVNGGEGRDRDKREVCSLLNSMQLNRIESNAALTCGSAQKQSCKIIVNYLHNLQPDYIIIPWNNQRALMAPHYISLVQCLTDYSCERALLFGMCIVGSSPYQRIGRKKQTETGKTGTCFHDFLETDVKSLRKNSKTLCQIGTKNMQSLIL